MIMNYIIEFEGQAINDIENIGDYIKQDLNASCQGFV